MPHVGSNGTAGADISDAGGAAPYLVAVAHLGEHSRHPRAMDIVYGGLQLRGFEWVLHDTHPRVIIGPSLPGHSARSFDVSGVTLAFCAIGMLAMRNAGTTISRGIF